VPAHLLESENSAIDELIGFAFDTFGDVRVYVETVTKALSEGQLLLQDECNTVRRIISAIMAVTL
jgi:hypothetical protein